MRFARKLKAVRDLRRSVQGGGFTPPYLQDLYPIPSDSGVCVVANHGGRYNLFDDTTTAIDQIGDETRALESDRCYTIPATKTGEIVLETPINYSKYFISKWLGKVNTLIYADSVNKYTYVDGVLTSTVAATNLTSIDLQEGDNYLIYLADLSALTDSAIETWMNINACLFAVDNVNFSTLGVDYNRYLCNESTGTTSFDSGTAIKNNGVTYSDSVITDINNVTVYNEKLKNRSNLEGYTDNAGLIVPKDLANPTLDVQGNSLQYVGSAKYNLDVVGGNVASFDGSSDINFSNIVIATQSISISVFFNDAFTSIKDILFYIPADGSRSILRRNSSNSIRIYLDSGNSYKTLDFVFSNDLPIGEMFDINIELKSESVICTVLGESIEISTFVQTRFIIDGISNGSLKLEGRVSSLYVDGVLIFGLNGHAINSVDGVAATNNGVTFVDSDFTTQATIDSLSKTVYKDLAGNYIVNPQYAATTETVLKGKGWKQVGNLDFSNGGETAIGHLPFAFFNQLAFETNTFGFTPIYTYDIYAYINFANPFSMSPELFNLLCEHPEYILEEYRGIWYKFYNAACQSTLIASVVYPRPRYVEEQVIINSKKGCPTYAGLIVPLTDENNNIILVNGVAVDSTLYTYEKDLDNNPILDENGNYIITLI